MCRPGHGSSRDPSTGGHTGPPLHEVGRCSGTNGNRRDTTPFLVKGGAGWCVRRRGVVTPPYGCATGDAKQRADVGIGPYASRGDEGRHAGSSCPTGGCGEPPRLPWVAAHSGASAARMGGIGSRARQRSSPRCPSTSDNPSGMAFGHASSLCTREPLGRGIRIAASLRSSQ